MSNPTGKNQYTGGVNKSIVSQFMSRNHPGNRAKMEAEAAKNYKRQLKRAQAHYAKLAAARTK